MNEKDDAQDRISRSAELIGVYKHYKGPIYTLYSVTIHEETLETMVHYYSHLKKSRWTRTFHNFFERLPEHGIDVVRFQRTRGATSEELLEALGYF
jgi:hypothetical protein